jgi:hypothetical protein
MKFGVESLCLYEQALSVGEGGTFLFICFSRFDNAFVGQGLGLRTCESLKYVIIIAH